MKIFILSARQQPPFDDDIGYFHAPPSKIGNDLERSDKSSDPPETKTSDKSSDPTKTREIERDVRQIHPKPHASNVLSARQQPPFDAAIGCFDVGFSSFQLFSPLGMDTIGCDHPSAHHFSGLSISE